MKVKHLTISHTSLQAWRHSPRRFYYEYVLGLRPLQTAMVAERKVGNAMEFGSCLHKFEELRTPDCDVSALAAQIANDSLLPVTGNRSKAHLIQLIQAYAQHYPHISGQRELELSFPITDRVSYISHIDLMIDEPKALIDIKTTSKHLAFDWLPNIAPNPQAIGYIYTAQQNGHDVDSLTFRGVSTDHKLLDADYIPIKRDGSKGHRAPLFLDTTYTPQPHEVAQWRVSLQRDVARLVEDLESMKFTCHCNIGDFCSYRQCCLTPLIDRTVLYRNCYTIGDFRGFKLEFDND